MESSSLSLSREDFLNKMGIEVYLIRIVPEDMSINQALDLFGELGFKAIESEKGTSKMELETEKGINEIMILEGNASVKSIFLRFSLANPDNIINQTMGILEHISKTGVDIIPENHEEPIDLEKLAEEMKNKKEMFKKRMGAISLKPIRGGHETFNYMETKGE